MCCTLPTIFGLVHDQLVNITIQYTEKAYDEVENNCLPTDEKMFYAIPKY